MPSGEVVNLRHTPDFLAASPKELAVAKTSILYLDDNEDMLDLFRAVCGPHYDVRTALSPDQGLEMLRSCSADIIVSDQRMPVMEGTEFLRRARELCPKSLRILLTGEARFGDVMREVSEGVVEVFTQKPWDPSELLEILERASVAFEKRRNGD
jgi:DNA-binding NtrC family response regulator